jgi:hypothetical protein
MPQQAKPTSAAYSVAGEAPPEAVAAAYRGALSSLRSKLTSFRLDLVSYEAWPADVQWAVEALSPRRPSRSSILPWAKYQRSVTIDLDLREDGDFQLAVALAPYTTHCQGLAEDNRIIYSGNDIDMSAYFELTEDERESTVQYMTEEGVGPDWLIPLPAKNTHS